MPYLKVSTNIAIENETKLVNKISSSVASASGKPESYVMIALEPEVTMSMAGNTQPLAFLDYRALGLPADRTAFSDTLCSLITNELGISGDRIYISMTDSERKNWGWNNTTF
jgi:phenylpyruvate tautomerase